MPPPPAAGAWHQFRNFYLRITPVFIRRDCSWTLHVFFLLQPQIPHIRLSWLNASLLYWYRNVCAFRVISWICRRAAPGDATVSSLLFVVCTIRPNGLAQLHVFTCRAPAIATTTCCLWSTIVSLSVTIQSSSYSLDGSWIIPLNSPGDQVAAPCNGRGASSTVLPVIKPVKCPSGVN